MSSIKYFFLLIFFTTVSGCTIGPEKRDPPAVFDLGPQRTYPAAKPVIDATLLIPAVSASPWLDSPNIVYRLHYRDAGRAEAYAQHRWSMSPALLLTERLRARFAAATRGVVGTQDGARADYSLRIELEDFSQSFDAAESAKAGVRLRASLIDLNTRALHAQKSFSVEQPAAPNAPGAAQSLAAASDAVVEELVAWATQNLKK